MALTAAIIKKGHSKAARAKAGATVARLAAARIKLGKVFGEKSSAFNSKHLAHTIARHEIPLSQIPEIVLKPLSARERKKIMAADERGHGGRGGARKNGAAKEVGIGIPLDAIPERKVNTSKAYAARKAGHPNGELVGKIIDLLANPETDKHAARRLLDAMDKLLGV